MSSCLRYQNPVIYRYRAAQYVAGNMTQRVRSRIEVLIQSVPELEREISHCADHFSPIHEYLPVQTITPERKEQLWHAIEKQLPQTVGENNQPWWETVLPWKICSGITAFAALVLAVMLWTGTVVEQHGLSGPAYLANMSAHDDPAMQTQFVVSAYSKHEDQPSRLHIQWTKNHAGTHEEKLHIWTEERETGKLSYIGVQPPKGQSWDLTKPKWQAITNSHRLLVTSNNQAPTDNNIIFSGLCLQLKAWKKQA